MIPHNLKYNVSKDLLNKSVVCCIMLLMLLTSFAGFSQSNGKKQLTAEDYHLWSSLKVEKLSEKAKWVSYSVYYENGNDTLFVKNNKGTVTYNFPKASKGEFIGDSWFSSMSFKRELLVTDLLTSKQEIIAKVLRYDLRVGTKDIILLKKQSDGKKELELKNVATNKSVILNDIDNYWYNQEADALVYTTKSESNITVALLNLRDKTTTVISSNPNVFEYSDIVWQKSAKSIAFLQQPLEGDKKIIRTCVGYYTIAEHKLYTFNPARQDNFPTDMEVIVSSFAYLNISEDGKRIFFGLQKTLIPVDPSQVQTWSTQDKFLYPAKVQLADWDRTAKVAVWWPQQNRFNCITSNEFPKMMLSGDQKQALLYNPQHYEPQANRDAPLDIYILNLERGDRKLVLQNQLGGETGVSVSIYEKQIVYFKDKHWWVYDIENDLHKNLTQKLGVCFSDEDSDWPEEASPYGNPGWVQEDQILFIYDKYDIWSITLDGRSAVRLTRGRKNKTVYRIVSQSKDEFNKMNYDGSFKNQFQPNERLLIKTEALQHTGYCFWDKKNGLQPLLDKKMYTSQFLTSAKSETYVYVEQNFNLPPRLVIKESLNSKEKMHFQSNPQHFKYNWGSSKLITYTNSNGAVLNGVLFYPAHYHTDTKYPMVVHVYEMQSKELYNYVNPSQYNPTGFNIANFTSRGYFVFLPDIVYEIGNPGSSAVDCVLSATKKVLATESSVDSTRIGLIGHSYGGYETDYIITQTNMFKTAVAGAAITDYISGYLRVAWGLQKPNFWHYEFGQLRIGKSLYEDYAAYLRNSPVYHADKVKTPLLSWAGEQDSVVHYYQSIEFHLALRRLGKINTMLIYPGEDHVLMEEKHQQDLTGRIEQWFDYYLKAEKKPEWL
ncbi:prolyl oligopeptidase family serine peptidase [Flavobacterium sp. Fl-318]|uniref:Prolyl oligopeptidase family serine peptidase n=1 Tax=Flavobacterium cupriresistens TaxID=2893885 RepID=A0ABU4R711_9FLAO|nr:MULTISPECIES: prolyl oligopeptidase family serine peptidase [unclassified Flavobacterium]MDX6187818.1 prolyl oligopeptidase family serine peptidase [Flavobacterium sp. Fl-318]UFH42260.1 prolyl oligopeptidase family serine peptidase [Flavobacterium sp. F-323]